MIDLILKCAIVVCLLSLSATMLAMGLSVLRDIGLGCYECRRKKREDAIRAGYNPPPVSRLANPPTPPPPAWPKPGATSIAPPGDTP